MGTPTAAVGLAETREVAHYARAHCGRVARTIICIPIKSVS